MYQVEILDNNFSRLAILQNTPELDTSGYYLKYSSRLSGWGTATSRVGTKDPLFKSTGDIFQPFANHVRITRADGTVWQGVIVKVPKRTRYYIEFDAYEYEYLLSRVLIRHDAADGNGAENYRTIKSGTMANFLNTIIIEAQADAGKPLTALIAGSIDNPNFPVDSSGAGIYKDSAGNTLSGPWTFSDNFQLKFDYRSIFYVIQSLANYCQFDFQLVPQDGNLVLNFKSFIGNKNPNLVFSYKNGLGNIEDYNSPLDGDQMANYLVGIAADNSYNILHADGSDTDSINTYGKIAAVAAYADAKDQNILQTRINEELVQIARPNGQLDVYVDPRTSYPLGQYGTGDTLTYTIQDHIISVNSVRRLVGMDIKVHVTGKESIRHLTNVPRNTQS